MDLENIILSEVSQIEKNKQAITYMQNLKNNVDKSIYKTETDLPIKKKKKKPGHKREQGVGRDKLEVWG